MFLRVQVKNKPMHTVLKIVLLAALPGAATAQVEALFPVPPEIVRNTIGVQTGYYNPAFSYWNKRTVYAFDGGVLGAVQLERRLVDTKPSSRVYVRSNLFGEHVGIALLGRISVGWFQNASLPNTVPNWGDSQIRVDMLPISISSILLLNGTKAGVYGGVGADWMGLRTGFRSPLGIKHVAGSTYTGHSVLGLEVYPTRKISIAIEGRYYLGGFKQTLAVQEGAPSFKEHISLKGWYLGGVFKYPLRIKV